MVPHGMFLLLLCFFPIGLNSGIEDAYIIDACIPFGICYYSSSFLEFDCVINGSTMPMWVDCRTPHLSLVCCQSSCIEVIWCCNFRMYIVYNIFRDDYCGGYHFNPSNAWFVPKLLPSPMLSTKSNKNCLTIWLYQHKLTKLIIYQ